MHEMRRKDKIITNQTELEQVIQNSPYLVLGIITGAEPYLLPIDFAYADGYIYIHCAGAGRKLELLAQNRQVSMLFVNYGGVLVPPSLTQACGCSTKYKSVMALGKAEPIEDQNAKEKAMRLIIAKFGIEQLPMPDAALAKTCLMRIKIETMSGKQSPKPSN